MTEPAGPARATPLAARAPGPDLARGFMLLFIALANSHHFLRGATVRGGYPQDGSGLDSAVTWLLSTFVDGRAFPMFGLLFGYGVARIADRQRAAGPRRVRRLLWRRSLVLVAVGLLHAVLLFAGDILTAYGVLLLVGALLVRWRDRWLLVVAVLHLLLLALPGDSALHVAPPEPALLPPDPAAAVVLRAQLSLVVALAGPIGFLGPFVLGLWAGRRRVLEAPSRHRTLLRVTAAAGLGAAILGAQPVALVLAGATPVPGDGTAALYSSLHGVTGVLGGLGYAALFALLADWLPTRARRPVTDAVAATGQRSMTCYLAQSPVWALVFTPFLLDLSGTLTVAGTALLAAATWAATVLLAGWLRRTGRRGPFESLVRRVTYGAPPR
ncbi:hypothetical protein GCM10010124_27820 [Pilimelia terevasa]|uniref:DUF418 domain-containing protein n=1 Tax=Pilimelia terevasa TaxID=53372 RepID=A0A8J3BV84_9ACTN|nr:DUF418 domain-containing protein [Pilimelia terevasa]GGK33647.1 hypothetical protein GCM10010124_27820 [Pilimelia terevasa]